MLSKHASADVRVADVRRQRDEEVRQMAVRGAVRRARAEEVQRALEEAFLRDQSETEVEVRGQAYIIMLQQQCRR